MVLPIVGDLASYEAWVEQIRKQLDSYKKLRRDVRYFPLFAAVTSPIGLFWSRAAAFVICLAWLSLWGTTLYITWMRTWHYKMELEKTLDEVARLREEA
jgi:hypothetical protein